jgi:Uma2 family endonuclease
MSLITPMTPTVGPGGPAWIPSPLYRMTIDEYEAMVASGAFRGRNRFHLINGYLVEKMTQHPPHTVADIRCGRELDRVIPKGWHVRPGKPIRIPRPGRDSEPEPDRCVARGRAERYDQRHPGPEDIALVAEIADSSLADDREYATNLYGPAGIPVCWIVDVNARRVEVYTGPGPKGYRSTEVFKEGQFIPVVIGGRVCGRIAVNNILPPRRRRPRAGGNGA